MLLEVRIVTSVIQRNTKELLLLVVCVSCASYVTFFTGNSPSSSIFQYIYFNNRYMYEKGILEIKALVFTQDKIF